MEMERGSTKGWLTPCLILCACGSPPPPGPVPGERTPPSPVANDCPAVGSPFGNDRFHVQNLGPRLVCQVYLEQDECVVAIWDDCTVELANTQRSWEGRIDPVPGVDPRIWMRSHSRGSAQEASSCQGTLELGSETPRSLLDCQRDGGGSFQMYLERRVASPAPLGEPMVTLSVGPAPIRFITAFQSTAGPAFLAAVSEFSISEGGGLFLFRDAGAGQFQRVEVPASYSYLQLAQASEDGRLLVVGGRNDLFVVDTGSLSVIGHESVGGNAGDNVAGIVQTGANEMIVGFRQESVRQVELQRYQMNPLARVGPPVTIAGTQLNRFLGAPGGDPLLLFVKEDGASRLKRLDPQSLAVRDAETIGLPAIETHSVLLDQSGTAAIFADYRSFAELSLASPELRRHLPAPYFQSSVALGYDPVRNWVFAGGVQEEGKLGAVYAIDRASMRPFPRPLVTNDAPDSIAVLGDLLFVAARTRIFQARLNPAN